MGNFRALGFAVATRDDAAALARAPLKRAPANLRLHESGSLDVHRLELGSGIELWSVKRGRAVVAAYPTFLARESRQAVVAGLSFPHTPFTPRLLLADGLAAHLVNYLFVPAAALAPGTAVQVAIAALLPHGLQPEAGSPGLSPAGADAAGSLYAIRGIVLETALLDNPATGQPLRWCRLAVGHRGPLETVCHAADAPAELAVDDLVAGSGTLRAAIVAVGAPGEPAREDDVTR
jgi:hypothetical protein